MTRPTAPNRDAGQELRPASGEASGVPSLESRERLARLMRSRALSNGEIGSALAEVTELACALFGATKASVWQLGVDGTTLDCVDSFASDGVDHLRGQRLSASDLPSYFEALAKERTLVVSDVAHEPRMSELSARYLSANGTRALLAAPVFLRGRLIGAVMVEHAEGPRAFALWEELALGTLVDFVALVLTSREQLRVERELAELRARVDEMLESRTNQVVRENADLQREVDALQVAAHAIRKSEDDLRRLFAASPVPMLLVRKSDQRVMFANERCASALRTQTEVLVDAPVDELFVHRSDLVDLFGAIDRLGDDEAREVQMRARDGEPFWALLSARSVDFSMIATVMIGFTDLTAQKAVEHQLRFLAQRDPLTQAYNRHHFWQLANSEIARVKRYRRPLSLAMIDADHFKGINDQYGHDVGDRVLRLLVDTCQDSLRKNDVLARYGGEEFIVLLPETTVEGAVTVVERLRDRIARTPLLLEDGRSLTFTVSLGLAGMRDHHEGFETLLKRADSALYEAKRQGRNCVVVG